jgi:spore germination protein (amino acid permease)
VASALIGIGILSLPASVNKTGGPGGWLLVLLMGLVSLISGFIIVRLGSRFPNQSFVQYSQVVAGTWIGRLLALLLVLYALEFTAHVSRSFGEVILVTAMPETPIIIFVTVIMALAAWAVKGGLESLARMDEFLIRLQLGLMVLLLALAASEADPGRLLPVWESGDQAFLEGFLSAFFSYSGYLVMLVIFPNLARPGDGAYAQTIGILIPAVLYVSITIIATAVLGASATTRMIWPTLEALRLISVAGFIERLESLFLAVWLTAAFTTITAGLYVLALGCAQILGLQTYRPLVLPLAALAVAVAMLPGSLGENLERGTVISYLGLIVEIIVPPILLLVVFLRDWASRIARHNRGV